MSIGVEDVALALALSANDDRIERDPLSEFSFTNHENGRRHEVQLAFVRHACQFTETYYRASNQNGKTHIGAALTIALVENRDDLDGEPLPKLQHPVTAWVLCQSWQGMVDGAGAKVRELLGKWPHKIAWINAGLQYIGTIYVKYEGCTSDDYTQWSKIVFHVEGQGVEQKSLPGARIDIAWADEPPHMKRWREVRARGKRNKPFIRIITATPLDRERWEPVRADFSDSVGYVNHGKIELVARLHDNPFLSDEHIAGLYQSWASDPFFVARVNGDYVDLKGVSPFKNQWDELLSYERAAIPPEWQAITIDVRVETGVGRVLSKRIVKFEWWHSPEAGESTYASVDTSLGMQDPDGIHDPGCCLVFGRKWVQINGEWFLRRRLLARFNGYESSYNMGSIAAAMGRLYNEATVDVETNGGYGDGALDALADAGYTQYAQNASRERLGQVEKRIGFNTNTATKPMYISQIQTMLQELSVEVLSPSVVSCLLNARMDELGRLYKPPGIKYEDLICLGRFLLWESMNPLMIPAPEPPKRMPDVLNEAFGRNVVNGTRRRAPLGSR